MRVLVLHSDVGENPPPDELETVETGRAIAEALASRGHETALAAFHPDPAVLRRHIAEAKAEAVFNMVESVYGLGSMAPIAPAMLDTFGLPYTGLRRGGDGADLRQASDQNHSSRGRLAHRKLGRSHPTGKGSARP